MTLKQKALLQTLAIFGSMIAGSLLISVVTYYFTVEQLSMIGAVAVAGFFVYMIYGIVLGRLESEATMQKLNESFKKKEA
jgi:VIT1/CCC1 family predicted Fe2+/Mn2+ transporter